MDVVVAVLVLLVGVCAIAFLVSWAAGRRHQAEVRAAKQAARVGVWEVAELPDRTPAYPYGQHHRATSVVVRRVDGNGKVVGQVEIARIRDDAPDWDTQMIEARAAAASRAALLNSEP